MKRLQKTYFAYRYLISTDNSVVNHIPSKEQFMKSVLDEMVLAQKTEWKDVSRRYVLYCKEYSETFYVITFTRLAKQQVNLEGETDIEQEMFEEAKFVHVLVNLENQIILVQKKSSAFPNVQTSVNLIEKFLRYKFEKTSYTPNIWPLPTKNTFWTQVDLAEEIFDLKLEMNSPNLAFLGHQKARDLVKEIKAETNIDTVELGFSNKEGNLRVTRDGLRGFIEYILEVGGKYILRYKEGGEKKTLSSKTDTTDVIVESNQDGVFTEAEVLKIEEKMNRVSSIATRDEES